ncbi:hypothetical protein EV363DRAFT_1300185 [Boletus edulis]|nr:hypothetical protein EV363DRAFT_1300185 [Boletus edulis]
MIADVLTLTHQIMDTPTGDTPLGTKIILGLGITTMTTLLDMGAWLPTYAAQLERVAVAIETPHPATRQQLDLPDDEPVNHMAPTHPRKKAPRRSGKGSKDKTSAAPPSPLVPTVQMARPVSGPAAPDGRFGYQVPAPIPTFVRSWPVAEFQQDRTERSATRSISAKGKTLGASTKVEATRPASGPDHHPTHGIQPSHSPATRSNTPAQSSRLPHESLHSHVSPASDQQLRSRHAQLAMSDGGRSSQSLSEEEDESDHPNMALKDLLDIEEGKEEGEEQEGDEMQEEDEEKEEDKLEEEREEEQGMYSGMGEEDTELDDLYGGASTQGDALANSGKQ